MEKLCSNRAAKLRVKRSKIFQTRNFAPRFNFRYLNLIEPTEKDFIVFAKGLNQKFTKKFSCCLVKSHNKGNMSC